MNNKDFSKFDIKDFVNFILERKINKEDLISIVDDNQNNEIIKKINFAYNRINQPLSLAEKISFILFPFGIRNFGYYSNIFDIEKEINLGFNNRINQYYRYSIIGIFFYMILFILLNYLFF